MKEPKYRFLLGISGRMTSNTYGYVDKQTGQFVEQQESEATTRVMSFTDTEADTSGWSYLSADGEFVSENSYVSIYVSPSTDLPFTYVESVQLSDIIGQPYGLPTARVVLVRITLDREEAKRTTAFPIYRLREVSPTYSNLSKKISREGNHLFFRETLDTDLHFVGSEADFLISLLEVYDTSFGVDTKFMLVCQRLGYETMQWENYHVDLFKSTECEFNRDAHTCKPTLAPLDNYTRLLEKYSDEYDLIKLKPAIKRIKTYLRPIIELYERGSSVITRFLGGTYWETEVDTPVDDENILINDEHFARLPIDPDLAYLDATFNESWSYPTGRYQYHSALQRYRLTNETGLWEWINVSLSGNDMLALFHNGEMQYVEPSHVPIVIIPNGYSGVSDLPLDQTGVSYISVGIPPTLIPIGAYVANKYVIFARVVGNRDTLFGEASFPIPQDDFAIQSHAYKRCAPLSSALYQGYLYGTRDTSLEPTIYGIKESEEEYYTNENLPVEGGIYGVRPMPIGKYEWGDISYWYNYADDYVDAEVDSRWDYVLKDCFTIGATIRALLAKIDHSITFSDNTVCSEFLFGKPDIKGGYGWKLAITPKSNILKGDYDQPARKAPITFENLMNMLRDLYHLYWYIDDDKRLHIEHAVWFINGGSYTAFTGGTQLDLSGDNCKDAYNKKRTAYWQDAYKFNMAEASRRIELDFAEDGTEFFNGLSIDMRDVYLEKAKTDAKSISNFTADIDLMRIEPERYSMDGFAVLTYVDKKAPPIFSTDTDEEVDAVIPVVGANRVMERDGWKRDAYINNFFASWLYCQHFLMYDISGKDIEQELQLFSMPNSIFLDEVHGLALLKKQTVQFPFENDPDTIDLIKTTVGSGKPEDFSVDALTRTVEATLAFPVTETVPPSPPLPYDAVVEYLQGDGQSWIVTDKYLSSNSRIVIDITADGHSGNIYGSFVNSSSDKNFSFYVTSQGNNAYIRFNGQLNRAFTNTPGRYLIEHSQNGFYVNGALITTFEQATFVSTSLFYLFNVYNSTSYKFTGKIHSCRCFEDNTLILDLIPVRVGSVGYMYDTVSGQLFGNSGTGDFIVGHDL